MLPFRDTKKPSELHTIYYKLFVENHVFYRWHSMYAPATILGNTMNNPNDV